METLKQQFIEDNQGHKVAVILPINQHNSMLEKIEEIEDIKVYDLAKSSDDEIIPFDRAIKEIEKTPYY